MGLSAGTRLGPYEIVAPLGAGGMGEVWRARDTRLGREVAIKVLPEEFFEDKERRGRFEKEARALAAVTHPNIAVVYEFEEVSGRFLLVQELLEGESLREKVGAPLPSKKAVEWALQVAYGLTAAHEKGIVHRDLKPENLFVTKDGHVKVLDFGVAKLLPTAESGGVDTETPTEAATQPGTAVGTVAYMSPEQIRGQPADARTDIFSFGVVLYEILAGKRPFQRGSTGETMSAILRDEPADLSETNRGVPAALENVVRHCLEKDPDGRFQSARDIAFALESLRGVSAAVEATPMSPAGVWLHRHRKLIAGTALAVVLVTVGSLLVVRRRSAASKVVPSVLALPCKVYGAPEVAYLTDAVPGTISTFLSQVEGIDTKVPPTSFEVEKVKGDLGQLADLYKVSSFIVTSITPSAHRFALNVQLVDAVTRKVRWGRQYEGAQDAYNDLARQAADGIRLAVSPASVAIPAAAASSEAELAMREGDHFRNRYNNLLQPADFEAAMTAYRRALERDSSSALAMAHMSQLFGSKFQEEGEASGARSEFEQWARRAVEIDSRCGEAWRQLAWVEVFAAKPNIERRLEYALKAVRYAPRDSASHMVLSTTVTVPGALSLQLAANIWGADLDPLYLAPRANAALVLGALGRPTEALPLLDRISKVESGAWALVAKGYILTKLGKLDEAREALAPFQSQFDRHPDSFIGQFWAQLRLDLAILQQDAATIAKLQKSVLPLLLEGHPNNFTLADGALFVSPGLARLGRGDEAIRILERGVEAGFPPPYDYLLYEPAFKPLRDDPRFEKVRVASRDGAAMIARLLGEARSRGELPQYFEAPLEDLNKLLKENPTKD